MAPEVISDQGCGALGSGTTHWVTICGILKFIFFGKALFLSEARALNLTAPNTVIPFLYLVLCLSCLLQPQDFYCITLVIHLSSVLCMIWPDQVHFLLLLIMRISSVFVYLSCLFPTPWCSFPVSSFKEENVQNLYCLGSMINYNIYFLYFTFPQSGARQRCCIRWRAAPRPAPQRAPQTWRRPAWPRNPAVQKMPSPQPLPVHLLRSLQPSCPPSPLALWPTPCTPWQPYVLRPPWGTGWVPLRVRSSGCPSWQSWVSVPTLTMAPASLGIADSWFRVQQTLYVAHFSYVKVRFIRLDNHQA